LPENFFSNLSPQITGIFPPDYFKKNKPLKKILMKQLLFIFFCLLCTPGFSQLFPVHPEEDIEPLELAVAYRKVFLEDSLNPNQPTEERMMLWIGQNTSVFFSYNRHLLEQQNKKLPAREFQDWLNSISGSQSLGLGYRVYKNYPSGELTTIDYIPMDLFLYREEMPGFDWQILADTDTVLGLAVQKAKTEFGGRKWIAWFAPGVPYNEGPYKFSGLPGLILRLHDTRDHFLFEATAIEQPDAPQMITFQKNSRLIETSKENFFRSRQAFMDDMYGRLGHMIQDNQTRSNVAHSARRRNNPIELRPD
jgi:GLPGLI family protein